MAPFSETNFLRSEPSGLQAFLDVLIAEGWLCKGPRLVNDSIHWGSIRRVTDFPLGWLDIQTKGSYKLTPSGDDRVFGVLLAAESAKNHLFPPKTTLWRAKSVDGRLQLMQHDEKPERVALIGLRPCDLKAIQVQDRVFLGQEFKDQTYATRRENTLLVAVNCTRSHETCFCTSVGGGPRADEGFDVLITEVLEPEHVFYYQAGSDRGRALLDRVSFESAGEGADQVIEQLCRQAEPPIDARIADQGLKELLFRNAESPHWKVVGERCYACGSCTQVCPTCFCHTPHDSSNLDGTEFERTRSWDSCFSEDYSYIHGGAVRGSTASRYRQWLTHKLASWTDQFEILGCVGCGRCVTWCPASIDIREEVESVRSQEVAPQIVKENPHV